MVHVKSSEDIRLNINENNRQGLKGQLFTS